MRIAFSGTHRTGKSTLLAAVAEELADHATFDEPYAQLEEEGHETSDPPSVEDFEAQLERALTNLDDDAPDVLFDRCPADVLAYLVTHEDADSFDADDARDRVRAAMETLDLVVFVPIEDPDRVALPTGEDRRWRRRVHRALEEILEDIDVEVLRVEGDVDARVRQVLARTKGGRS